MRASHSHSAAVERHHELDERHGQLSADLARDDLRSPQSDSAQPGEESSCPARQQPKHEAARKFAESIMRLTRTSPSGAGDPAMTVIDGGTFTATTTRPTTDLDAYRLPPHLRGGVRTTLDHTGCRVADGTIGEHAAGVLTPLALIPGLADLTLGADTAAGTEEQRLISDVTLAMQAYAVNAPIGSYSELIPFLAQTMVENGWIAA